MADLNSKVALVTGAARGQGRSHAVGLARDGADIIAIDICGPIRNLPYQHATADELADTADQVKNLGRQVIPLEIDVRDLAALRDGVDGAVERLGRLDIVVANAGICIPAAWDQVAPEVWQDTIDINLTGAWNTVSVGGPHVVAAGGGSIILVSSAAGLRAQPFLAPYVASKFGLTGLAQMLSLELASHNVRVNSIHPTGVRSPMGSGNTGMHELIAANPKLGVVFQNALDVQTVECEDVTHAIRFLVSEEARFITGLAMTIDAGTTRM
jgi:SDR family mycofactocin-dependent oxidoreductase